jgi:hypothetical protein
MSEANKALPLPLHHAFTVHSAQVVLFSEKYELVESQRAQLTAGSKPVLQVHTHFSRLSSDDTLTARLLQSFELVH